MKTPLAETFPSFRDSIRNAAGIDATIDFKASFDSLEIMEGVTRHFFLRPDRREHGKPDRLKRSRFPDAQGSGGGGEGCPLSSRETVRDQARRRHNAKVTDGASLDDLLVKIKGELEKLKPILGPIIELEVAGEPQG